MSLPTKFETMSINRTHIVKKIKKWECKMCGETQSVKKVYGQGTGKDCRLHTQKLNEIRLKKEEIPLGLCNSETGDWPQVEYSVLENQSGESHIYFDGSVPSQYGSKNIRIETAENTHQKKIKLDSATDLEMFKENNFDSELTLQCNTQMDNLKSASTSYKGSREFKSQNKKPSSSKWGKYFEETKPNCYSQDKEVSSVDSNCSKYLEGTKTNCYTQDKIENTLSGFNSKWGKYLEKTETTCRQDKEESKLSNFNKFMQNTCKTVPNDNCTENELLEGHTNLPQNLNVSSCSRSESKMCGLPFSNVDSNLNKSILSTSREKIGDNVSLFSGSASFIHTEKIMEVHKKQSIFEQHIDDDDFEIDF